MEDTIQYNSVNTASGTAMQLPDDAAYGKGFFAFDVAALYPTVAAELGITNKYKLREKEILHPAVRVLQ